MSLKTQLAYLAAAITLILGVVGLLRPTAMSAITGLYATPAAPHGMAALRATFGGLFMTLGVISALGVLRRPASASWLRLVSLLWFGSAAGRIASITLDRSLAAGNVILLLLELGLGGALLIAGFEDVSAREKARRHEALGEGSEGTLHPYLSHQQGADEDPR